MNLGNVIQKERQRRQIDRADAASALRLSSEEYEQLESGVSPVEHWGRLLGQLAVELEIPTSRLIAASGRASDAGQTSGQCGALILKRRRQRRLSIEELAAGIGIANAALEEIERGESPLEQFAPRLLRFAELIEQPVFNLLYPCGLPLEELEDYP